jgi:hypothetical protein
MPADPAPDRLAPDRIEVDVAALARAADVVGGAAVAAGPPSLVAVVFDAVVELGSTRSADALGTFAAAWQQVVVRLGQRAVALARGLSAAGSVYTAADALIPGAGWDGAR